MKSVISQITVITQQGVGITNVGDNVNGRIIDRIIDQSLEYEDSFMSIYDAYDKEGNLLKRLENCPVDISYKVIED
jgi:hypothetical protein